ncbi:MAG: transglutaminase family protein [Paracoccaceae bacterium]|nr:transglutaminase family protein [Paracoccaceae bacterium]
MRLQVRHATTYRFDPPVRGVVQSIRAWPSTFEGQTVIEWSVEIDGAVRGSSFRDGAGDQTETFTLLGPVRETTVVVSGIVETIDLSGILSGHRERVSPLAYLRSTRQTRSDSALRELAAKATIAGAAPLEQAHALSNAVRDAIEYVPGETHAATTAAEALASGRGVCQDHAHVLIAAALTLGIPARYATGYLHAEGGIAEASHAWAELWVKDLGWVGFDPSNGVCPDERYIRISSGADAFDAAPIRGLTQGVGDEALDVDVQVVEAAQ